MRARELNNKFNKSIEHRYIRVGEHNRKFNKWVEAQLHKQ